MPLLSSDSSDTLVWLPDSGMYLYYISGMVHTGSAELGRAILIRCQTCLMARLCRCIQHCAVCHFCSVVIAEQCRGSAMLCTCVQYSFELYYGVDLQVFQLAGCYACLHARPYYGVRCMAGFFCGFGIMRQVVPNM